MLGFPLPGPVYLKGFRWGVKSVKALKASKITIVVLTKSLESSSTHHNKYYFLADSKTHSPLPLLKKTIKQKPAEAVFKETNKI